MKSPIRIESDSIEYYKILTKLAIWEFDKNDDDYENRAALLDVYYEIGDMLSEPDVLNDRETLADLDKYHIDLYESHSRNFWFWHDWMNPSYYL